MIDIIGAIALAAVSVGLAGALGLASPLDRRRATRVLTVGAVWFTAVVVLAAVDAFNRIGPAAVGLAVLTPIVIAVASPTARTIGLGVPLSLLVATNVTRVLGVFFLVLQARGRLPLTFAMSAGWGDIIAGALAPLVAWLASRRASGWRPVALAWNAFGLLDLIAAVALGIGSAPESPLRFLVEDTAPGTMGTLPWVLIPAFLVPLYVLTHLAVFARLVADRTSSHTRVLAHVGNH